MKLTWCTILVVAALLVVATIDAQPDPPAVNPSTALCKVLQPHYSPSVTVTGRCESLRTFYPFRVSLVTADACEPYRPNVRTVLTVQAADPSPPAPQAGRKPSFQS